MSNSSVNAFKLSYFRYFSFSTVEFCKRFLTKNSIIIIIEFIWWYVIDIPISNQAINKPRTAKVGAISKAQNLKGGPFGLCKTPAGCKKFLKNFKWDFHSAEKCKRGDPLQFFDIHCVAKYRNKWSGDPLMQSKKLQKKSHSAEKKWG